MKCDEGVQPTSFKSNQSIVENSYHEISLALFNQLHTQTIHEDDGSPTHVILASAKSSKLLSAS